MKHNRWAIVAAGAVLQLCLGTVYAWSYFQKPLVESCGWTNAQASLAFSLAICFLGIAAAWGGARLPQLGPRRLAMSGAVLYAAGYFVSAVALRTHSLLLLYAGYGVLGGVGLGLGYVTPVATVSKWFPDRKGLATGTVIMGFGFGALMMSKVVAPALVAWCGGDMARVFAALGLALGLPALAAACMLVNPPGATGAAAGPVASEGPVVRPFALLWLVFFCNIVAGIALIGFQSPLLQDLLHARAPDVSPSRLAAHGATLIAVSSLFNGLGRLAWGAISDRIGRARAFRLMLGSQALVFVALAGVRSPWMFGLLVCYILLCYGGGFGTMPSFVADVFGARRMAAFYGAVLTAWSAAGLVGPQLAAFLRDLAGERAARTSFLISAGVLAAGFAASWLIRDRRAERA